MTIEIEKHDGIFGGGISKGKVLTGTVNMVSQGDSSNLSTGTITCNFKPRYVVMDTIDTLAGKNIRFNLFSSGYFKYTEDEDNYYEMRLEFEKTDANTLSLKLKREYRVFGGDRVSSQPGLEGNFFVTIIE